MRIKKDNTALNTLSNNFQIKNLRYQIPDGKILKEQKPGLLTQAGTS
jgi:hypothetical protein